MQDDSLERRVERIERLLEMVLERLSMIESLLQEGSAEARIALRLVASLSVPVMEALRVAQTLSRLERRYSGVLSEFDVQVLEIVYTRGPQTLRGLERALRVLRGRASRETIKRSVRKLERLGLVTVEWTPSRVVVRKPGARVGGDTVEASGKEGL